MSLHDPEHEAKALVKSELDTMLSPFDLKRLESYANNMLDYHVVLDLIPTLATLYFTGRLPSVKLTGVQSSILLAVGLQRKDLSDVEKELSLPSTQLLAMFIKIMRKLSSHFAQLVAGAIEAELPQRENIGVSRADASAAHDDEVVDERFVELEMDLDQELEEGGDEAMRALREKQRELIDALPLDQYEVATDAPGWQQAEAEVKRATMKGQKPSAISVKTLKAKRKAGESAAEIYEEEMGEKKKEHRGAKKARKGKN